MDASLVAFANHLADLATAETLPRFRTGLDVTDKGGAVYDPVTEADQEAERVIRAAIEARYPEHGIVGEEHGTVRADAEHRWVLDPVDGTRAFVTGCPSWTTLIALEQHGEPILGVIDQPYTGERWVGAGGRTLWRRAGEERTVRARGTETFASARITCTDPFGTGFLSEDEAAAFQEVARQCQLSRFSLDAYGYGLLASGQFDLVVESSLKHYDYAALVPVVRGAGGVITGWKGEPPQDSPRGRVVAAATPALHAAAIEVLRRVE